MIRYLDFSDDYFGGSGDIGPHPSDNICGVMAAAESAGADGRALILGMVIAYEACAHLVDKINYGGVKPTWDYTVLHAIATSLGAGRVLGLSRAQIRDALALATVSNISLLQTRQGELSNWKGIAGPNGSRNGLFAAMLAREGITGPEDPFEGKAGWMKHLQDAIRARSARRRRQAVQDRGHLLQVHAGPLFRATDGLDRASSFATRSRSQDIDSICVYVRSAMCRRAPTIRNIGIRPRERPPTTAFRF